MLYKIGTVEEIHALHGIMPEGVLKKLYDCTVTLDKAYGTDRDYLECGGYSIIAENPSDVEEVTQIIDLLQHPCEWVDRESEGFLSALYLLNDDFSIVLFMPIAIAPVRLRNELED